MTRAVAPWMVLWAVWACSPPECRLDDAAFEACEERCAAGEGLACARLGAGIESGVFPLEQGEARHEYARACRHAGDDDWLRVFCADEPPRGAQLERLQRICAEGEEPVACWAIARHVSVSIPLETPPSEPPEAPPIIVDLGPDTVSLDGEPITLEALARRRWPADARAIIRAERESSHTRFLAVIDALRAAGVTRYAINVNPDLPP